MFIFESLRNNEITSDTFKDTLFFSLAEWGAMGEPGALIAITSDKKMYHFNYVYGDTDITTVQMAFPTLKKCDFGMFGIDSKVPEGWNYVNLGAGNHLIVTDSIYPAFNKKIEKYDQPSEVYAHWIPIAADLLDITEANKRIGDYIFFWQVGKPNDYLSQWYPRKFDSEGIEYETAEQYMMAKKALLFNDITIYNDIMSETDPAKCKDLGKLVRGFDPKKWDDCKEEIIYKGNLAKFSCNYDLQDALIETGDAILAEASPYDKVWGIGREYNDPKAQDLSQWKGQNLLGNALMKVREELDLNMRRLEISDLGVHAGMDQDPSSYYVSVDQAKAMDDYLKKSFGVIEWSGGQIVKVKE